LCIIILTFTHQTLGVSININNLQQQQQQQHQQQQQQMSGVPVGGMNLYELSARPWLYSLSQKYQKSITALKDVPDTEWKDIKSWGFDMVFLMGVWQLGKYGLNFDRTNSGLLSHYSQVLPGYTTDDIIGSPYAVTNYTCNSQLGTDSDILALKKKLNAMGLLLMLDYVPNHTAVDSEWATTNPDNYVRAPKGTNPPYPSDKYTSTGIAYGSAGYGDAWQDTLQINIWNPDTRTVRTAEVLHVASLADGIRCDMAYLELNSVFAQSWGDQLNSWGWKQPSTEWWADTIKAVKTQYPNVIFLAEVYSPYEGALQSLGFDYTYDKVLRDKLGGGNLDDIRAWISARSTQYITQSAHYISNHDEQRGPAYFGSWWKSNAAAALLYTLPGMRYYWMWDMEGYSNQLDVHLRREQNESNVSQVEAFYKQLLDITTQPVFRQGTWTNLNIAGSDTAWRLIGYRWAYGNERRLCVINFSDTEGWGNAILADAQPGPNNNDTIPVTELLTNQVYYRSASALRSTGLGVGVNSWYAQIFKY
jgi:hypothetical protein